MNHMTQRSRTWVFTVNNPRYVSNGQPTWIQFLQRAIRDDDTAMVVQLEQGANGTPHLQGVIRYKNACLGSVAADRLEAAFYQRPHVEKCLGGWGKAAEYCRKLQKVDANGGVSIRLQGPWEFGDLPAQGKRKDVERAAELYMNPLRTLEDKIREDPGSFMKWGSNCQRLHAMFAPHRKPNDPMTVILLHGPPGGGKTTYAQTVLVPYYLSQGFRGVYFKGDTTQWWHDYEGEEIIICDEAGGHLGTASHLNMLLDPALAPKMEVKGAHRRSNAKVWIFTTNYRETEWYDWDKVKGRLTALQRRIHHFGYMNPDGLYQVDWHTCHGQALDHGPVPAGWVPPLADAGPPVEQHQLIDEAAAEEDEEKITGPRVLMEQPFWVPQNVVEEADEVLVPPTAPPRRKKKKDTGKRGRKRSRYIDDEAACSDPEDENPDMSWDLDDFIEDDELSTVHEHSMSLEEIEGTEDNPIVL